MANVTTPSTAPSYSAASVCVPPALISKKIAIPLELMPWWRGDVSPTLNGVQFLALNRAGVISGKVTLDETPVVGTLVYLFYLPSMLLIRTGRTDANGDFSFDGLDRTANKYVAVARIPPHNAMIFDTLTPV